MNRAMSEPYRTLARPFSLWLSWHATQSYAGEYARLEGLGWPRWASAESLTDLGVMMVAWLEGQASVWPGHVGPPDPETAEIRDDLIRFNLAGYVTTLSRPGRLSRTWRQRATVSGFASQAVAERIRSASSENGLVVQSAPLARPSSCRDHAPVSITQRRRLMRWSTVSASLPTRPEYLLFPPLHGPVSDELNGAIAVSVIDPEWGQTSRLWDTVAGALARPVAQAREPSSPVDGGICLPAPIGMGAGGRHQSRHEPQRQDPDRRRTVTVASTTDEADLATPAERVAAMLRLRPAGEPWPSLDSYKDQPVCGRCGRDETGVEWPCCGDMVRDCPEDVRYEAHVLACAKLFRHDWLCDACKQIVVAGPATSAT